MRIVAVGLSLCLGISCLAAGGASVTSVNADRYRVVEPLFECVRVVLNQRGEKYSPAYVQGVSGAAFRLGGPCPCAPTCCGAVSPEELLALFGYDYEVVSMCEPGMDPAKEIDRVVGRIKDEIRAGRAAIVFHAFTSAEYDVVSGFDEGKQEFLGRGSYCGLQEPARAPWGRAATCGDICPPLGAILVGEKTRHFDAREAELDALEEAVRHARAPRDPFVAQGGGRAVPWRLRRGLGCYEAWIAKFVTAPGRVPDVADRYPLSIYRSTHAAAADFLRELAPRYPEARGQLEGAAVEFNAEAAALGEVYDKLLEGWQGWKAPDEAKAARAVELLTMARDHYAAGIRELEAVLAAVAPERRRRAHEPARVLRHGGRVWIAGVPSLRFGEGKDCTYLGAMQAALGVTSHPYSYSDLMGLSGLAFRTRWSNGETATAWCHSAAVGELPDEGEALQRATGWPWTAEWVERDGRDNEALRQHLVREIDAGRPVLSYLSTLNFGVVYGYEEGGRVLLTRDYSRREAEAALPVEKLEAMRLYLGRYQEPPPLQTALRGALQRAVSNWQRQKHDGGLAGREYWYGAAALQAWSRDLRAEDPASRQKLVSLDAWCYLTLLDARKAAVLFLRDWSTVQERDAAVHLRQAASTYEKEVKLLAAAPGEAATPEARAGRATTLDEAAKLESEAIDHLRQALVAMPGGPGTAGQGGRGN